MPGASNLSKWVLSHNLNHIGHYRGFRGKD
jgi:hypothetical protein